jgi:hypothetical protein
MSNYMIIGIHGLKNKPRKENLQELWTTAIQHGLERNEGRKTGERPDFSLVYWATVTYGDNPEPDQAYPVGGPATGPFPAYDENFWDRLRAEASDIVDTPLDLAKRWLGIDALADGLLGVLFEDLKRYYEDEQVRSKLRQLLEEEILRHWDAGKRILLIAHSMGSIIAYDTLRELGRARRDVEVDHLVTIGSPLGLPHVKYRIWQENDLVRTPSIVKRWSNLSERRDPVAFDTHLAGDYGENRFGVRVVDDLVANETVVENGEVDFHSGVGYLRTPEMSRLIRAFL